MGRDTTRLSLPINLHVVSADLVLLCSFGPDLIRLRTARELCHALLQAGYRGPLGRHLILTSPLLQRRGLNRYALRPFAP